MPRGKMEKSPARGHSGCGYWDRHKQGLRKNTEEGQPKNKNGAQSHLGLRGVGNKSPGLTKRGFGETGIVGRDQLTRRETLRAISQGLVKRRKGLRSTKKGKDVLSSGPNERKIRK